MIEIRICGRGGQGVITTGQIIARAAWLSGHHSQFMPYFGVERSGSPVFSFVRIDNKEIITREKINKPDIIIVQDRRLLSLPETTVGAGKKTKIIVNTRKQEKGIIMFDALEAAKKMGMEKSANIAIASFCCLTELNIAFKNINESIKEQFKEKGEEIIKKNIAIVRKIYESHQRSQSGNFKK